MVNSLPFFYTDIFDPSLYESLTTYVDSLPWFWGFKSSNNLFKESHPHWSIHFDGLTKTPANFIDVEDSLPDIIKKVYQKIKEPDTILVRCYANGITHGLSQRVHVDDSTIGAKTHIVFLNKEWSVDWGGETIVWENQTIVNSFLPKRNSLLTIDGTKWHGVRPISPICYELRKTLMFKTRPI
jgi:SM-20-related protein